MNSETRFWNASGIEVSAGANGLDIRTESIVSVLVGGIAFDVPEFLSPGESCRTQREFTLYPNRTTAMTQPDPVERHFVLYFNESLRGLSVGAPVTLFGLTVGHVANVGLTYDAATLNFRPRVLITFNPERIMERLSAQEQKATNLVEMTLERRTRILRHLVEDRGLRAKLETGNLLTGELYVAIEYVPNAPKPKIDWSQDPLELPVDSGGLASIEAKLNSILTKIDNMPLEKMGSDVKNMLASLNQTLKTTDALLGRVDAEWVPEGTKTMEDLHRAIADADRSLLGRDAPTSQNLHDTLQEVAGAARSVRVFIDYLQRHPEIFDPRQERGAAPMIRRLAAIGAACALAALPIGCASPPSHLYTLSQTATVTTNTSDSASNLYVVVGPVSIPPSVDLPQIVVRTTPNQVRVDEFNRWAAPLQGTISHVVAGDLVTLLGDTSRRALSAIPGCGRRLPRGHRRANLRIGAGRRGDPECVVDRAPRQGRQDADRAHDSARAHAGEWL